MSSSSSDSDSDDLEPIRRIKINIRPKEDLITRKGAADVNEIKASVEAWRPLGLPPHPSLSRRQSSLSSVSSISYGTGSNHGSSVGHNNSNNGSNNSSNSNNNQQTNISANFPGYHAGFSATVRSSPSCSSLVNEFNSKSMFSNFLPAISRPESPLTILNLNPNESITPIAIAIQESIELLVKGIYDPNASQPRYETRCLGNIKVAFPSAFALNCHTNIKQNPPLKLRLHSTDNISKYYAIGLIKDLDLSNDNTLEASANAFNPSISEYSDKTKVFSNMDDDFIDLTSTGVNKMNQIQQIFKYAEFDMNALSNQLSKLYESSPRSRYYNVDVLRYQIRPIKSIEECPLQVCAYWKIDAKLIKLRIDFKPSNFGGLGTRLREIIFTVNLKDFFPLDSEAISLSSSTRSTLRLSHDNNNDSISVNMNDLAIPLIDGQKSSNSASLAQNYINDSQQSSNHINGNDDKLSGSNSLIELLGTPKPEVKTTFDKNPSEGTVSNLHQRQGYRVNNLMSNQQKPYITYKPEANWNNSIKQLSWKFDNLTKLCKEDSIGSLFAKIDFRNSDLVPKSNQISGPKPPVVDVKFLVVDSTASKLNIDIDSIGYKMSMLKKEIRSAQYRCEPYIM